MFPFTKSEIIVRIFLVARYNRVGNSVDLNHIEITNKMGPCSIIYYSNVP